MAYRAYFTQSATPPSTSGFDLMAEHVSALLFTLASTSALQQLRYKAGSAEVLSSRLEVEAWRGCGVLGA